MALTPPGDLYVGVNDAIFPKLFAILQTQRPSLLNYATPYFAAHPELWCQQVPPPANGAPVFTPIPPIQYLGGTQIPAVEFVLQVADFKIGFGVDTVGLPSDLQPLPPQRVAIKISANARFAVPRLDPDSIGCPSLRPLGTFRYPLELCDCFTGTFFATVATAIIQCGAVTWIAFTLDRFDTPNFSPAGLRQTIDHFFVLLLDSAVLPKLWMKLAPFVLDLSKSLPASAPIKTITITPSAPSAKPNPDVSANLLRARFGVKVTAP